MSNELQQFAPQIVNGKGFTFHGKVSAVGWEPDGDLSYEQWEHDGQILQGLEGSLNWIIGDWITFGERKYGEMYTQAIEWTGNKLETLKIIKYVSANVERLIRVNFLSWTHHRYIAHLPEAEQRLWLSAAADNEWSSRELLQALEEAGAKRKPLPQPQWTKDEPEEEIPFSDPPEGDEEPPYNDSAMYESSFPLADLEEPQSESAPILRRSVTVSEIAVRVRSLQECEEVVAKGLQTFVEVGNALMEIRDRRLYLETHSTFEEYCRDRWGMRRDYANKLISSAGVVRNLDTIVSIFPATESQARPLTRLRIF